MQISHAPQLSNVTLAFSAVSISGWAAYKRRFAGFCLCFRILTGESGFRLGPFSSKSLPEPRPPRANSQCPRHGHHIRGDCVGHSRLGKTLNCHYFRPRSIGRRSFFVLLQAKKSRPKMVLYFSFAECFSDEIFVEEWRVSKIVVK